MCGGASPRNLLRDEKRNEERRKNENYRQTETVARFM